MSATLTNQKCVVLQVYALEATTIAVWQPAHFPHFRALSLDLYLSLITPRSKLLHLHLLWVPTCLAPLLPLDIALLCPVHASFSKELSQSPSGKESSYEICSSVACPLKAGFVNVTTHWMTSQPRELRSVQKSQPPLCSVSSVSGGLCPSHACQAVKLRACSQQTK